MPRPAIVKVLRRVDSEPGAMILASDEASGREAAIYLDPPEAMSLADELTLLVEQWTGLRATT